MQQMFLKKLWKFNKIAFVLLILYFSLFIFFNLKTGIVAAPILQFGMFSGIQKSTDTQAVYKLFVNGNPINLGNYSFTDRDIIVNTLDDFANQKNNNKNIFNKVKLLFDKCKAGAIINNDNCLINVSDTAFTISFKNKLKTILHTEVNELGIYKEKYILQNNELIKIDSPQKIDFIVTK